MAKNYDWERAKALYGLGKSFREIEKETGIPFKNVQRKVEQEGEEGGWIKGNLTQLSSGITKVFVDLTQQNDTVRNEVIADATTQASRDLKAKGVFFNVTMTGVLRIAERLREENDLTKLNHGMQALKTARQAAGIEPYFNTAPAIQNANIQGGKQSESVTYEIVDSTSKIDFKGDK